MAFAPERRPTDLHLSDVHLHCPGSTSAADEESTYTYLSFAADEVSSAPVADVDGDPILKRRRAGRSGALKLRHALATPLPDVGLQVWRGALLLCDYLLARPSLVHGTTVLELGSGCGLCGWPGMSRCLDRSHPRGRPPLERGCPLRPKESPHTWCRTRYSTATDRSGCLPPPQRGESSSPTASRAC